LLNPERSGDEGRVKVDWVPAGEGSVCWSEVFKILAEAGFTGPLSVHAEYHAKDQREFEAKLKREIAYFRKKRDEAMAALKKGSV
jgi:sugar phosphate isomerase/epimerase